jgi:APA family basic amino acid/polyamine antiporter
MAQPRLQYALAKDGLLPSVFGELDSSGNLTKGTMICGVLMVIVATFIPFTHLNDMISCAVLTALSLTDTSLILLWHPSPAKRTGLTESLLGIFHAASLTAGIVLSHFLDAWFGRIVSATAVLTMIACISILICFCPRSKVFGGSAHANSCIQQGSNDGYFRTPFVPLLPCLGICINWYLISQLELLGIVLHLSFLSLAVFYYFVYAIHHSVGNNGGWLPHTDIRDESSTAS